MNLSTVPVFVLLCLFISHISSSAISSLITPSLSTDSMDNTASVQATETLGVSPTPSATADSTVTSSTTENQSLTTSAPDNESTQTSSSLSTSTTQQVMVYSTSSTSTGSGKSITTSSSVANSVASSTTPSISPSKSTSVILATSVAPTWTEFTICKTWCCDNLGKDGWADLIFNATRSCQPEGSTCAADKYGTNTTLKHECKDCINNHGECSGSTMVQVSTFVLMLVSFTTFKNFLQ